MKSISQTTDCIACDSKDVSLVTMCFMGDPDAKFPISHSFAPYLRRVFTDPSFGQALIQFLEVKDAQQSHQDGGAYFCAVPDSAMPTDFGSRMGDFDLHCAFIGQRIRALRASNNDEV
jgi:hypothetical protein